MIFLYIVQLVQCYNEGHLILNHVFNWSLLVSPTRQPGPLLCPTSDHRSCRWGLLSTGSGSWLPAQHPWLPAEPPAERGGSSRPQWPTPPGPYPDCPHCHGRSYEPAKDSVWESCNWGTLLWSYHSMLLNTVHTSDTACMSIYPWG